MKRLNYYIAKQLVVTTVIAVVVLTFVLLSVNLMRASDLLAKGVSPVALLQLMLYMAPEMLGYALPLAWLCAAVLVFSGLSAGHEISAMRASGISLWQIVSPALLFSVLLSVGCLMLQFSVVPVCKRMVDRLEGAQSIGNPAKLLEPGQFVKFSDYIVYIDDRDKNLLRGVHIYVLDGRGRVSRDITARKGRIEYNAGEQTLVLHLQEATIITIDRSSDDAGPQQEKARTVAGRDARIPVDLSASSDQGRLTRDLDHMTLQNLFGAVHAYADRGKNVTPLYVELHVRLSLALSPFALLLVGIPCGIRTQRRETSIGIAVSLLLAMFFYAFLVCAEGLEDHPGLHPELFAWVPNILYQAGGLCAILWIGRH